MISRTAHMATMIRPLVATGTNAVTTGGIVTIDTPTLVEVVFSSNDTLGLASGMLPIDYAVVGGGGGGGGATAGGGGGGGEVVTGSANLTGNETVTVGAGGAGGAAGGAGSVGSPSSLGAIATATGGGFGAQNANGGNAVNGGGGGLRNRTGGTGTRNGGASASGAATVAISAGGGGAGQGAAGTNGANNDGGAGGAGITVFASYNVAGGGGGGSRSDAGSSSPDGGTASHGGGAGSPNAAGTNGTANTGGGGGGGGRSAGGTDFAGGNGGSGIVIVQYDPTAYVPEFPVDGIAWAHVFYANGPLFRALGLANGASMAAVDWPDEIVANSSPLNAGSGTYRSADAAVNNRPVVETPGVAAGKGHSTTVAGGAQVSLPYTIIVIFQNTVSPVQYVFDGANEGSTGNRVLFRVSAGPVWSLFMGTNQTGGVPTTGIRAARILCTSGNDTVTVNASTVISGVNAGDVTWQGLSLSPSAEPINGRYAFWGIYAGDITADANWANFQAWVLANYGVSIN